MRSLLGALGALGALGCLALLLVAAPPAVADGSAPPTMAARSAATAGDARPLAGRTVVVGPGHQLGHSRHLAGRTMLVGDAAGVRKACAPSGTAPHAGYPEATFAWQ